MDLIEKLFGIAPDNGSGLTEFSFFLVIAIMLLAFFFRHSLARAFRSGSEK